MAGFSKTREILQRGDRASQPAAADVHVGTLYFVTDEIIIERSNGSSWDSYSLGAGGVIGPASATDHAIARFDGTTGKLIQNSSLTIDDSGNVIGDGQIDIAANALLCGLLKLIDTAGDHYLTFQTTENFTASRTLNLNVGNATRTITLSGDPTLADWFDQSVKVAASPTFAALTAATGHIRTTLGNIQADAGTITSVKAAIGSNQNAFDAQFTSVGDIYMRSDSSIPRIEMHIRALSGSDMYISWTEDAVADRWVMKVLRTDSNLYFGTGNSGSNTTRFTFSAAGLLTCAAVTTTAAAIIGTDLTATGGVATFANTGLHLLDTNASHDMIIKPGSDYTADRIFTITTGDAARTLDLAMDLAVAASAAAYTPAWTSSGTAPVLGNGTLTGTKYVIGKLVYFNLALTWGSTTTGGTGVWAFTLPLNTSGVVSGAGLVTEAGVANHPIVAVTASATTFNVNVTGSPGAWATVTAPFTWGTGDILQIAGVYIST